MKPGMTISCAGHALALGFAVVAISAQPMNAPPVQTLDAQIISEKDFSQMTKGVKNGQQSKDSKALADKIGEEKSVDQAAPKVADKPPITTDAKADPAPKPDTPKPDPKTAAKADPKPPDPKPPDPKPDAVAQAKPDPKPKPPEYKPDQIANLLKKDAAKDNAQQKQNTPKFDANQVAELLDQRAPQRQYAAASQINNVATLGSATATQQAELSQDEIGALRACLKQKWNPPAGFDANSKVSVMLRVDMRRDGWLMGPPEMVGGSPLGPTLAESARRAIFQCQPFTMLKPEHYDDWKELDLNFDPSLLAD